MSASSAFGLGMSALNFGISAKGVKAPPQMGGGPLRAAMGLQTNAADVEQQGYNNQADLILKEAGMAMEQKALQVSQFRESQALNYSGHDGVLLEGSPMLVLNETRKLGQQELDAIAMQGTARADLMRQKAYIVGSELGAKLLGEQDSFLTQGAQAKMAAAQASGGMLANAFNGLQGATGNALGALFGGGGGAGAAGGISGGAGMDPYGAVADGGLGMVP